MNKHEIIAYFPEWETRRPYYVKDIEKSGSAEKITIINYAFGIPGPDEQNGGVICKIMDSMAAYGEVYSAEMSIDGQADNPQQALKGHFNQLRKLKAKYPHIRVVVSLGGWTGSGWFSDAAKDDESRRAFVKSCIDLYIRGDLPEANGAGGPGVGTGVFDGIDIDWEYPQGDGLPENHVRPDDDENFYLLLQEFRRQYAEIGRSDLLLTVAVPGPKQAGQFKMQESHKLLDIVSLMTYDLHGDWNPVTGHHTNLMTSPEDPEAVPMSADKTIKLYLSYGVPAEKIMIGAAFYGRAWQEVGGENHGLYQRGVVRSGGGGSNYRDLVKRMEQGYTRYWDELAQAPWLYSEAERTFWTFDDPQSVAVKAQYVRQMGLGGVMFWEITGDDDQGTLVDTIYQNLK